MAKSKLTKDTTGLFPSEGTETISGVMGNFVTGYGGSINIPFFGASKYTITLTGASIYGVSGDKASEFSIISTGRDCIDIHTDQNYAGKYITFTVHYALN